MYLSNGDETTCNENINAIYGYEYVRRDRMPNSTIYSSSPTENLPNNLNILMICLSAFTASCTILIIVVIFIYWKKSSKIRIQKARKTVIMGRLASYPTADHQNIKNILNSKENKTFLDILENVSEDKLSDFIRSIQEFGIEPHVENTYEEVTYNEIARDPEGNNSGCNMYEEVRQDDHYQELSCNTYEAIGQPKKTGLAQPTSSLYATVERTAGQDVYATVEKAPNKPSKSSLIMKI